MLLYGLIIGGASTSVFMFTLGWMIGEGRGWDLAEEQHAQELLDDLDDLEAMGL